jgi:hypothetical protein
MDDDTDLATGIQFGSAQGLAAYKRLTSIANDHPSVQAEFGKRSKGEIGLGFSDDSDFNTGFGTITQDTNHLII